MRMEILGLSVLAISILNVFLPAPCCSTSEYTYYIAVDWKADEAFIVIVGVSNDTSVLIYRLPNCTLVDEVKLNSMDKRVITLTHGGIYKVLSDNPVYVMLFSAEKMLSVEENAGPIPPGFHTSVNGTYVGRLFIIFASQSLVGEPYRILALERSKVTIRDEDGKVYLSFGLEPNEYRDVSLSPFRVYRISSTGRIMISSGSPDDRSFFIPAVEGGFMGRTFFFRTRRWHPATNAGFRVLALEDTRLTVWSVDSKRKIQEFKVKGGCGAVIMPRGDEIMVESDRPVSLIYVHNWTKAISRGWEYASGVTYMGVKAHEETLFFIPYEGRAEALIFAYEDTYVEIDDIPIRIKADNYYRIDAPGAHRILSDRNVVIQMIHECFTIPESKSFAVVVPCIQTLGVPSNVKLTPLTVGGGFPIGSLTLAICAAAVAAGVLLLILSRRGIG